MWRWCLSSQRCGGGGGPVCRLLDLQNPLDCTGAAARARHRRRPVFFFRLSVVFQAQESERALALRMVFLGSHR